MTTNNALDKTIELSDLLKFEGLTPNSSAQDLRALGLACLHRLPHLRAALLDAPETVEGLENLEEALERESKFQGLMFCDHGKIDRSDKGIGQAFAIYQAARLYAQSRQSAGVPAGSFSLQASRVHR